MARLSALCLCTVPWIQISKAVSSNIYVSAFSLVAALLCGMAIHVMYLTVNTLAVNGLELGGRDPVESAKIRRPVILVASQKTLPVAVTLLSGMTDVLGDLVGLAVVPCVFSHLGQIVLDSFLVSGWLADDRKRASSRSSD